MGQIRVLRIINKIRMDHHTRVKPRGSKAQEVPGREKWRRKREKEGGGTEAGLTVFKESCTLAGSLATWNSMNIQMRTWIQEGFNNPGLYPEL